MFKTLSVLLPVQNAEAYVLSLVERMLELAADLTARAEIWIVDRGSVDGTAELAGELEAGFPQVKVLAAPPVASTVEIFRQAMAATRGEAVLYRDLDCRLNLDGLGRLWEQLAKHEVVIGRAATGGMLGRLPELPGMMGRGRGMVAPALQLYRRSALQGWMQARSAEEPIEHLRKRGIKPAEVMLRELPAGLPGLSSILAQRSQDLRATMAGK